MTLWIIILLIFIIILILFLLLTFVGYWIPKWPTFTIMERFAPSVRVRFNSKQKYIALTFDDVPYSKKSFSHLLEILSKYNVQVTFFVISGQVTHKTKPLLIQAIQKGHQLANHGKTDSMHVKKPFSDFRDEFEHCHRLIVKLYLKAKVTIPKNMFYRPGCGWFNKKMLNWIKSKNYTLILGSVYPHDPYIHNSKINLIYLRSHIKPGDIIILHDRKWTPPLIEKLLPWIQDKHFQCRTLDWLEEFN